MSIIASRSRNLAATPISVSGASCSSRNVSGADVLLHSHEERVQRLVALVDLDLDLRMGIGEVRLEPGAVGATGIGADQDRHELAVEVEELLDQPDGGVGSRRRD